MKKLLLLALAAGGLVSIPTSQASAAPCGPTVLPTVAHNNLVVLVDHGRRYHRVRHWRYVRGRREAFYTRVYL